MKIKKDLLYFLSLFIFLFISYTTSTYGLFFNKYILVFGIILFICITLYLNLKKQKIYKKNLLITFTLIFLTFVYIFRNIDISISHINGSWYFVAFMMMFSLQFSSDWTKQILKVMKIFSIFYLISTIICLVFRDFYAQNILPLFADMNGYADLYNQYRANMIAGFTGNYGINAIYLTFGFLVYLSSWLVDKENKKKNLSMSLIFLFAILITGKRGAAVFSIITAIISYLLINKNRTSKKVLKLSFGILALIILFFIFSTFIPELNTVVDRFLNNDDILNNRTKLYKHAINIFSDHPIFGIGWGNFKYDYGAYSGEVVNVHNIYLQLLCELGLIGFATVTACMLKTLFLTYKLIKSKRNVQEFEIILTFSFIIQVFIFLIGITSTPIYGIEALYPYLVSCMIPYVITIKKRDEYYE